ncbi:hypothetical protein MNBD_DELTA01-1618 [hydrothermal vent metagenome]|uniref:Uncharacterized protein n=1 Tax=hydrothermal vent metagenome TaxID=652676 RepID=A0A3B0QQJ0_9ZZZZ
MATEDLSTYTEVDPSGDLTVTSSKCTADTMASNIDVYLRDDKGASHFGDFEHLVTAEFTSNNGTTWPLNSYWALTSSASVVSQQDMITANEGLISYHIHVGGGTIQTVIKDFANGNYDIWTGASFATPYYMTIERSGTAMTCKIYSDSGRTTLVDTLSLTCGTQSYRYIFAIQGHGSTEIGRSYSGYVESLDLQETGGAVAVEGSLAAVYTVSGSAAAARELAGVISAVSNIASATHEVARNIDGTVRIVADVTGNLQAARTLVGVLSASSSLSGALGFLGINIRQDHGKVVMEVRSLKTVRDSQVNWIDHGERQRPKIVH